MHTLLHFFICSDMSPVLFLRTTEGWTVIYTNVIVEILNVSDKGSLEGSWCCYHVNATSLVHLWSALYCILENMLLL